MKINNVIILLIILSVGFININNTFGQTENSAEKDLKTEFNSADKSKKVSWNGEWNVPSRYAPQGLEIKMKGNDKFEFELIVTNGANIGDISGTASIKGNKAFFDDREMATDDDIAAGCQILFVHKMNSIEIKPSNECSTYAGNGVYFEGEYLKGKQVPKEQNFVQIDIFPNAEMDTKFKNLVGEDYEKFLDTFHMVSEGEDIDNLNTKVFEACVRGICPVMAGIIMFDESGKFYATVLDINDDDQTTARYYTNNPQYTQKCPKTIENWLEDKRNYSKDLKVIFKSK